MRTPVALLSAVLLLTSTQPAQVNYARAERFLPWHASLLVTGDSVNPEWFQDGNRFWYRNKGASGPEWWTVDPVRNTRLPLWDNARLAAAREIRSTLWRRIESPDGLVRRHPY